jgi:hypothetical protein
LKRAQSAFVAEAEDIAAQSIVSDSAYSNGEAVGIGGSLDVRNTVNVGYEMDNIGVAARVSVDNGTHPGFELRVNGNFATGAFEDALVSGTQWFRGSYSGGPISGSTDYSFVPTSSSSSIDVDLIVLYDRDYSYTFDNSVDSNGHLSGPELYPAPATATLNPEKTGFNIGSLTASLTINDTSNGQSISLSNDGANFTTKSNTSSATVDFTAGGRTAQVKLTLDGFGSRTTATPTERYKGQSVDAYDLTGDLNDLVVIDEISLTGDHFENLQQLHEYGNFLWVIEHDGSDVANLTVTSFQEGDETRPAPSEYESPLDKNSRVESGNYYNAIFLRGATDSNGNQPTASVDDSGAISEADERIEATLKDPKITTEAGAEFRAQSLLDEVTDENKRRGSIEIPLAATATHPGYARDIDFDDGGGEKTIEEVRLQKSTSGITQTHDFSPPDDVSKELEELKRNARDTRDQV